MCSRITLVAGLLSAALLSAQTTTTPKLTATPASAGISFQQGAATQPAPVTLQVKSPSGTPLINAVTPASGAEWLIVTPASMKSPATFTVRINPTGLAVAVYTAPITFSTSDNSAAPVTVPVTLTVTAPPPALTVSSTSLNFVAPPNNPVSQSITLSSSTGANISYTAAVASAPWVSITPSGGVIVPGLASSIRVTVDATGMVPQTAPYTAKITITANGVTAASKTQNINVNLTVNAQQPTVSAIWPAQVPVNSPAVNLTVRGTNFVPASVVKIGGSPAVSLATTYLSATVLQAVVPAASMTLDAKLKILVSNPAPGGDAPQTVDLDVTSKPIIQAVTSAASYVAGTVSPGELVSLFGLGIGPATPVYLGDADLNYFADTTAGGVAVTVDNKPAPLLFAGPNQITIAVPFGVTEGQGKAVGITIGTAQPVTTSVTVEKTNPAIFTVDGSGRGQAAAVNVSGGVYSLNSTTSPAKKGDTVVLYVTGQGSGYSQPASGTNPAQPYPMAAPVDLAGYLNPVIQNAPVPALTLTTPPVVTIGGAAATVAYAGPAPGSIMGLVQINAVVPAGSATGNAVPVLVSMGGKDSQAGVTLAVK